MDCAVTAALRGLRSLCAQMARPSQASLALMPFLAWCFTQAVATVVLYSVLVQHSSTFAPEVPTTFLLATGLLWVAVTCALTAAVAVFWMFGVWASLAWFGWRPGLRHVVNACMKAFWGMCVHSCASIGHAVIAPEAVSRLVLEGNRESLFVWTLAMAIGLAFTVSDLNQRGCKKSIAVLGVVGSGLLVGNLMIVVRYLAGDLAQI